MVAGGAGALAANLAVSKSTAADIITEFQKDLTAEKRIALAGDIYSDLERDAGRQVYGMPQVALTEHRAVWYSVADVANVWADHLAPELRAMGFEQGRHRTRLETMCKQLARRIDEDLAMAQVGEKQKVLVDMPKLRRGGGIGNPSFEIAGGLESKASVMGERFRVGYIQEDIIAPGSKRGTPEYAEMVAGELKSYDIEPKLEAAPAIEAPETERPSGAEYPTQAKSSFVSAFMEGFERA